MFDEISLNSCKIITLFTLHFHEYYTKFNKNFLGIVTPLSKFFSKFHKNIIFLSFS